MTSESLYSFIEEERLKSSPKVRLLMGYYCRAKKAEESGNLDRAQYLVKQAFKT